MPDLSNPFLKFFLPILGIVLVYFIATRKFNYSLTDDLYLVPPPLKQLLFWTVIWMTWMLGTDLLFNWRGAWDFTPWRSQPLYVSVLRVSAVVFLGPICEEMVCRGFLLTRLNQLKFGKWTSLLIVSAVWAVMHIDYSVGVIAMIFVSGLLLGLSVYTSRSLIIPIVLHIIWNLYAVW